MASTIRQALGYARGAGEWKERAACRGPHALVFFPPAQAERRDEREHREARAKQICAQCAVREPCLEAALARREQHGIWGGLTESERRHLLERTN